MKASNNYDGPSRYSTFLHGVRLWLLDRDAEVPPVLAEGTECGSCHACCITPSIRRDEILPDEAWVMPMKPAFQPCSRLRGGCCSVYAQRPRICRDFWCAYRAGLVDERPDQTGVVWSMFPNPDTAATEGPGFRIRGTCQDLDKTLENPVVRRQIRLLASASFLDVPFALRAITLSSPERMIAFPLPHALATEHTSGPAVGVLFLPDPDAPPEAPCAIEGSAVRITVPWLNFTHLLRHTLCPKS